MRNLSSSVLVVTTLLSVVANAQTLPLYINAGGTGPVTTTGGITWVPDTPFVPSGKIYSDTRFDIAGTNDDVLFHTERFFRRNEADRYYIDMPKLVTEVEVTLFFAEN